MTDKIEYLKNEMLTATDPWHKIDILNDLAWELRNLDAKQGFLLSKMAHEQATTGQFKEQPYQLGLAYSLRNLSYFNNLLGQFEVALSQGLAALALFEGIGQLKPTAETLYTIGQNYSALNDFKNALIYHQQALEITQAMADLASQRLTWQAMAEIYEQLGDYKAACNSYKQYCILEQKQSTTSPKSNPDSSLKTEILNLKQTQLNLTQNPATLPTDKALSDREQYYRSLLDNAPIAIMVVTINGHIIEANPTACTWLGLSSQNIQQYKIQHQFHEPANWTALLRLFKRDGQVENFLLDLATSKQTLSRFSVTLTRQPHPDGAVVNFQLFMIPYLDM